MCKIYMGKVDREKFEFKIEVDKLLAHTFITGQSGCGKSTLVSRYIEEIILRDVGNVLLFDLNYEFNKFDQIDVDSFKKTWNCQICEEDTEDIFKSRWETKSSNFEILKHQDINIKYQDLTVDMIAFILSIDKNKDPGGYWLIQLINSVDEFRRRIRNKDSLDKIISDVERWYEGRISYDDHEYGELIYRIKQHVTMSDITKLSNGTKQITNGYIVFRTESSKKLLNKTMYEKLFFNTTFCSIDLLSFPYDDRDLRDFLVLFTLRNVWTIAKENFQRAKTTGEGSSQKKLFIVIDEAHNILPANESQSPIAFEVQQLLKTIAAEGRKFGLFLIMISQRPNKINKDALTECDNYIVMKSTPPTISTLKSEVPVKEEERENLCDALNLRRGEALYCGHFSDYKVIKVKGCIKRSL